MHIWLKPKPKTPRICKSILSSLSTIVVQDINHAAKFCRHTSSGKRAKAGSSWTHH